MGIACSGSSVEDAPGTLVTAEVVGALMLSDGARVLGIACSGSGIEDTPGTLVTAEVVGTLMLSNGAWVLGIVDGRSCIGALVCS